MVAGNCAEQPIREQSSLLSTSERHGLKCHASCTVILRLGHPEPKLIDKLTFTTVREDLDSHSLQVLEAVFTQAEEWPPASAERELLYAAICGHLAVHCPTRRSSSQPVAVALRLRKGEEVYTD
jgi:hypothetical protein